MMVTTPTRSARLITIAAAGLVLLSGCAQTVEPSSSVASNTNQAATEAYVDAVILSREATETAPSQEIVTFDGVVKSQANADPGNNYYTYIEQENYGAAGTINEYVSGILILDNDQVTSCRSEPHLREEALVLSTPDCTPNTRGGQTPADVLKHMPTASFSVKGVRQMLSDDPQVTATGTGFTITANSNAPLEPETLPGNDASIDITLDSFGRIATRAFDYPGDSANPATKRAVITYTYS